MSQIARDSGLGEGTLYKWQKEARANSGVFPGGEKESEKSSTRDKFDIVVETAILSWIELTEYCQAKGLFVEQIEAWRDTCIQAIRLQKELHNKERENKNLARELKRKEAALAKTASLLVLRKKARATWGTPRTNDFCLRSSNRHHPYRGSRTGRSKRTTGLSRALFDLAYVTALA